MNKSWLKIKTVFFLFIVFVFGCILFYSCSGGGSSIDPPDVEEDELENQYSLNISLSGSGTVILEPEEDLFSQGTVVTLIPVPLSGHNFSLWSGSDQSDIMDHNNGTWSITMDSDKSLSASFIQTDPDLWIAPYHPSYQWDSVPAADVPWEHITHLIAGYLWPVKVTDSEYTVSSETTGWGRGWENWQSSARSFIEAGHAENRKVMCMLGGDGSNPGDVWNFATSESNVGLFAENIKNLLQTLEFDGVDLDWENNGSLTSSDRYTGLIRLSLKLREIWPEAIITIPTSSTGDDATYLAPAKGAVDAFMPMTYISFANWGGYSLPIPLTPLHSVMRPTNPPTENPYSLDIIVSRWENAGVPAAKIVMGVGGFGSVWGDNPSDKDGCAPNTPYSHYNENPEGEYMARAGDNRVTQAWVDQTTDNNSDLIEGWDDIGKCSYWYAPTPDNLVTAEIPWINTIDIGLIFYETPRSMSEKYNYCNDNGLKGMMFWTLSQMKSTTSSYPNLEF